MNNSRRTARDLGPDSSITNLQSRNDLFVGGMIEDLARAGWMVDLQDEVSDSHRLNVTGSVVLEPSHRRQMHEHVLAKGGRCDAALIGNLLDEFHRILELLSVALPLEGRVEFLAVTYRDFHLAHGIPHTLDR